MDVRCSACDCACRIVRGEGPVPAPIMLIGEKPGREEAAKGRPFVGDTGIELSQTYLPKAGLQRHEVRITNTVKCRLGDSNAKPTDDQIRHCAGHWIPGEVTQCQPQLIVLLGSTACQLVPKIQLDRDHGLPMEVGPTDSDYFGGWSGWVVPLYHPAAGLHDTAKMIPLIDDFERLGKWIRGDWEPPTPNPDPPEYDVIVDADDIQYDFWHAEWPFVAMDTEKDGDRPWCMQYSMAPGVSHLIWANDADFIQAFRENLEHWELPVLLHHSPADLPMLWDIGAIARDWPFIDSMQTAYHAGNLPQGLKALAWRLLGERMQSWEDLVTPHSLVRLEEWLKNRLTDELSRPIVEEKRYARPVAVSKKKQPTAGKELIIEGDLAVGLREFKPTPLVAVINRIIRHLHSSTYRPWKKLGDSAMSGEGYPIRSIAHAPLDDAVYYACRDADMTGQVYLRMKELEQVEVNRKWSQKS